MAEDGPRAHNSAALNNILMSPCCKLETLVYDILPPTTAITDYTIGLGKLSANEFFFVDVQMVVSL